MKEFISKLSEAPVGQVAQVHSIEGDSELNRRLREMGFYEGAQVVVKSRMFFGGPLAVEMDHFPLALRLSEAEVIRLKKIESSENK